MVEIDYTNMFIASLIIIIVALIVYEYRKPREMQGIAPTVLFSRFKESMDVLSEAAKQKCFKCGGILRVLPPTDLYEKNLLKLACEACGITEVWQRREGKGFKKTQWILTVTEITPEDKKIIDSLKEMTAKVEAIEKDHGDGLPAPPEIKGPGK